ncbi:MAG: radical SAM family heme chaperone HemW [Thermoanaerobaculum sp.]|nr:radical SAM family heme chaperone HemW [Thermoanaerobaculum sp.]MDW7967153.1 radical SAM family heme chaperone HemW [Thermoanaerobaculum sp.]
MAVRCPRRLMRASSLYIHLPFCASTCAYCSFVTTTRLEWIARYMAALRREVELVGQRGGRVLRTLYLGGGTPSLVPLDELAKLFATLDRFFPRQAGAEVTLEANPDDVTQERLEGWRQLGINRVSLGIQSFADPVLRLLGRRHTAEQGRRALRMLLAFGFVVSCDLMLGLPGLQASQLEGTVRELLALAPHHVSAYLLELDKPHRLAKLAQRRPDLFPAEDEVAQQYLLTARLLEEAGFRHYEVSNWARPGYLARHNLRYWMGGVVLACGVSAYGQGRRSRWANTADLGQYLAMLERGLLPRSVRMCLTEEERTAERVMLALRLDRGAPWEVVERVGQRRPRFQERVKDFLGAGLAVRRGRRLRLTPQGWLLSNELFATLV